MYSFSVPVVPRASNPLCLGFSSFGSIPVHHGSQAEAPGLIQEISCKRLGVARLAIKSELGRSAAVRPYINTRHGLTRGAADATSPLPSDRLSSVTFTAGPPVPVIDIPAQSSRSDSATAK